MNVREFDLLFNIVQTLDDPADADAGAGSGSGSGSSSNATTKAREIALASIAANNRLVAANTAQRIAANAAGTGTTHSLIHTDTNTHTHANIDMSVH